MHTPPLLHPPLIIFLPSQKFLERRASSPFSLFYCTSASRRQTGKWTRVFCLLSWFMDVRSSAQQSNRFFLSFLSFHPSDVSEMEAAATQMCGMEEEREEGRKGECVCIATQKQQNYVHGMRRECRRFLAGSKDAQRTIIPCLCNVTWVTLSVQVSARFWSSLQECLMPLWSSWCQPCLPLSWKEAMNPVLLCSTFLSHTLSCCVIRRQRKKE